MEIDLRQNRTMGNEAIRAINTGAKIPSVLLTQKQRKDSWTYLSAAHQGPLKQTSLSSKAAGGDSTLGTQASVLQPPKESHFASQLAQGENLG